MTIPEIEEALNKQQAEFAKLIAESRQIVENIKELRHQIGVPCAPPGQRSASAVEARISLLINEAHERKPTHE